MYFKYAALGAFALAIAACAKPEPEPIYAEPTFDKAGNASCFEGFELATTEAGATVCAPVAAEG